MEFLPTFNGFHSYLREVIIDVKKKNYPGKFLVLLQFDIRYASVRKKWRKLYSIEDRFLRQDPMLFSPNLRNPDLIHGELW